MINLYWKDNSLMLGEICMGWIRNTIDGWHIHYYHREWGLHTETLPCTSESEARAALEAFAREQITEEKK